MWRFRVPVLLGISLLVMTTAGFGFSTGLSCPAVASTTKKERSNTLEQLGMMEAYGQLLQNRPNGGFQVVGVSVWKITPKSPAATAGLKVGDTIEAVDGEQVYPTGEDDPVSRLTRLLGNKKKVALTVIRDLGGKNQKTLKLTLKRP